MILKTLYKERLTSLMASKASCKILTFFTMLKKEKVVFGFWLYFSPKPARLRLIKATFVGCSGFYWRAKRAGNFEIFCPCFTPQRSLKTISRFYWRAKRAGKFWPFWSCLIPKRSLKKHYQVLFASRKILTCFHETSLSNDSKDYM